jgi:hypothetical protein
MHKLVSLFAMVYLTGCASNQLGDFADISAVDGGRSSSPLKISARFSPYNCSDYFAYLDFSIENPTSHWQALSDLELSFPYQSNALFSVIKGKRLALWREGEGHRQKQQDHNDVVTSLAVAGVGLGLMATDNNAAQATGATLYAGNALGRTGVEITRGINQIETSAPVMGNYLVGSDIEIPPGMTRKFWLVLSADDQAPLMASIGGEFKDAKGVAQVFRMPLEGWESCQWQKSRKAFLGKRAKPRTHYSPSGESVQRNKIKDKMTYLINRENEIQQNKQINQ